MLRLQKALASMSSPSCSGATVAQLASRAHRSRAADQRTATRYGCKRGVAARVRDGHDQLVQRRSPTSSERSMADETRDDGDSGSKPNKFRGACPCQNYFEEVCGYFFSEKTDMILKRGCTARVPLESGQSRRRNSGLNDWCYAVVKRRSTTIKGVVFELYR